MMKYDISLSLNNIRTIHKWCAKGEQGNRAYRGVLGK